MLYVGGGVARGEAHEELRALAERTGAPVVTTLTARGVFPDSHPSTWACRACTAASPPWPRSSRPTC